MDPIASIAAAAGLAWASGLRLYMVLFFAGLLGRLGYIHLPSELLVLQHPLVLSASGLMFFVEFFADKIPALDSVWDAIHTFIRIPGGALLAAAEGVAVRAWNRRDGLFLRGPPMRALLKPLMMVVALALGACASLQRHEPLQVTVADIESLPAEGLELRMMVKLRIQNPNDTPIEYDGVYVRLDVLDKTFATGVSDERGTIPRFGEAIIGVPVTASTLSMVVSALGMLDGQAIDKIKYKLDGKLSGPAFGSTRFQAQGEFALPGATPPLTEP